jgi:hypothetical protein
MESGHFATIAEGSGLLTPSLSETAFTKPINAMDHVSSSQDVEESKTSSKEETKSTADAPVSDIPKPIIYRVEYKNAEGKLIRSENLTSPFSSEPDNPYSVLVFELTTTLVSKSSTEKTKEANTSTEKPKLAEPEKSGDQLRVPSDMRMESHVLKIHSPYVLNALRSVVKYRQQEPLTESTYTIRDPFITLAHYIDELRDYWRKPHPTHSDEYQKCSNEHMGLFFNFFDASPYLKHVREELARQKLSQPTCTYNYIWIHFVPGELCYIREQGRVSGPWVIFSFEHYDEDDRVDATAVDFNVTVWNAQFNGTVFGRVTKTINVKKFKDERLISTLPVIPAQFLDQASDPGGRFSKEALIARGKAYWNLAKGPAYREYYGKTLEKPYNEVSP